MEDTDSTATHYKCMRCQHEWNSYEEEVECEKCGCKFIDGY